MQTERIAIYNDDEEDELKGKARLLSLVLDRLSSIQRDVIQRDILDNEGEYGAIISVELGLNDRTFRRAKYSRVCLLDLKYSLN
ncbi:hypothetical protein QUF95_07170 [Paenibacillus silvae]|uniref:hypothetical protein n=1 Tax=Paenibacillus silvae TaxID=1325358 RepID=UPI0025A1BE4A|nr:hypothetical protein [Paenibacillus silvae]MDM5277156.1 hypothetical protein [Paenibacillus silvae]